jgi:hypothetical protein
VGKLGKNWDKEKNERNCEVSKKPVKHDGVVWSGEQVELDRKGRRKLLGHKFSSLILRCVYTHIHYYIVSRVSISIFMVITWTWKKGKIMRNPNTSLLQRNIGTVQRSDRGKGEEKNIKKRERVLSALYGTGQ